MAEGKCYVGVVSVFWGMQDSITYLVMKVSPHVCGEKISRLQPPGYTLANDSTYRAI